MYDKPKESDWKTFRGMVEEMRERYLAEQNKALAEILSNDNLSPTEQFWEVEEKSRQIAKILCKCLDGHTRSKMNLFMVSMLHHGLMTDEDLARFSPELREQMELLREI